MAARGAGGRSVVTVRVEIVTAALLGLVLGTRVPAGAFPAVPEVPAAVRAAATAVIRIVGPTVGPRGILIGPHLAVTHAHPSDFPGSTNPGSPAPGSTGVVQWAYLEGAAVRERAQGPGGSVARYMLPARQLCASYALGADHALWTLWGRLPDGVTPVRPTSAVHAARWAYRPDLPPYFWQVRYVGIAFHAGGAPMVEVRDARPQPGWSGAPVFDERGDLVGLIVAIPSLSNEDCIAYLTGAASWQCR